MIDPKSQSVTNFFMVVAIIVMVALAWSVNREPDSTSDLEPAANSIAAPQQSESAASTDQSDEE